MGNDAVIVQKLETNKESTVMQRNVTDTMPAQIHQMYSHPISVSAELPDLGSMTMNDYPSKEIQALQDLRPSFIVTLPNKEKMEETAEDPITPINTNTNVNYHQQAIDKQNDNENYIVTTKNSDNNNQRSCCASCI